MLMPGSDGDSLNNASLDCYSESGLGFRESYHYMLLLLTVSLVTSFSTPYPTSVASAM